uniref:Periphilin-1 C-terminal domain-containing protein n=1 Tax=Esox lucius TaxID=8010 RepID=A0A3P9AP54_ESOLU
REESHDKRPCEGPIKRFTWDERRSFRSMRSPPRPRVSSSFRPRFGGRFFRPRFMRDDHVFRKPRLSLGFQRYNSFSPRPRFTWREQPGSTGPDSQYNNQRNVETNSPTRGSIPKKHTGAVKYSAGPSRNVEKQPVSFKVSLVTTRPHSRQDDPERDREIPAAVSRAAIRNRAIQQKRKEIERVYRQDCDTFGVVVKMLVAKDPSLERPIQSSLQENLRDIGLRCVEAMQQFIEDYDTREPLPL